MNMKIVSAALAAGLIAAPAAFAAQPVAPVAPNATHLTKSPAGSVVEITGQNQFGNETNYVYKVQQDGSLKLEFQNTVEDSDN
ncbi:hypothetical protein FJU08_17190 [Martelella alba]|uniref:Uncharacterized protein n=1 Tax=Martelella alba TaxID=2590451 RepID=A0A506U604_9HYPH|nr:hypothetical protein [Martelella alba]TPW28541.1 hypothetical protein FJU08_17190 [Martelella alba]